MPLFTSRHFPQSFYPRTIEPNKLLAEDRSDTAKSVERLMGTKAETRFAFIQERAEFASEDMLDV